MMILSVCANRIVRSLDEVALVDVGLGNDGGQVLLGPLLGGHVLLENHHFFKPHLLKLLGVLQDDGCQHVQAQLEVVVLGRQVGVEQPQADLHAELPQQQAGHPLEVHVVEVDVLLLEVPQQLRVHPLYHFLDTHKRLLDPRPRTCVVIQNAVQNFTQAVVGVAFDFAEMFFSKFLQFGRNFEGVEVDFGVLGKEDDDEGSDYVVDALDVAAGRVAHVPDVEQSEWHEHYLRIIFWIFSWRKRLLSGRVRITSSFISLNIFFYWASCSKLGFSM